MNVLARPHPVPLSPLLLALSLAFPATAMADDPAATLEHVTVSDERQRGFLADTVEVGTFRGASILEVPATVNVVTREVLDAQAATGIHDALRNTAGVTRQQLAGDTFDHLAIRGITLENRSNYRLNGSLPLINLVGTPLENKERVEVLKGVSALYYGFTTPAGIVNLVSKRAGFTPVSRAGLTLDDNGGTLLSADLGRRFGERQQYGVRINAVGGTLRSAINGVDGRRELASLALDWKASERLNLKADIEHYRKKITEQTSLIVPKARNGRIALPALPDPKQRLAPRWAVFDGQADNLLLRADYSFSDNWMLTLETGGTEASRRRAATQLDGYDIHSGDGRLSGQRQRGEWHSRLLRTQLVGQLQTGPLRHELIAGYAQSYLTQAAFDADSFQTRQNLYHPSELPWLPARGIRRNPAIHTSDRGLYAMDRLTLSPRWQLVAGLRHTDYRSHRADSRYTASLSTPLFAALFRPTPDMTLYASHASGLEQGARTPPEAVNRYQLMPPGISKQTELGWRAGGEKALQFSSALFAIERPAAYLDTRRVFVQEGREHYRGLEASLQGALARDWSLQASAQWLQARLRHTGHPDGNVPANTPAWTASLFARYTVSALPGLSVNGGAYYTGRRPVNHANQAWVGGYTLFGLGARYQRRLFGQRTAWQLNVDNAGDKRYWAGGAGSSKTYLSVGAPRSARLTMTVDL